MFFCSQRALARLLSSDARRLPHRLSHRPGPYEIAFVVFDHACGERLDEFLSSCLRCLFVPMRSRKSHVASRLHAILRTRAGVVKRALSIAFHLHPLTNSTKDLAWATTGHVTENSSCVSRAPLRSPVAARTADRSWLTTGHLRYKSGHRRPSLGHRQRPSTKTGSRTTHHSPPP